MMGYFGCENLIILTDSDYISVFNMRMKYIWISKDEIIG